MKSWARHFVYSYGQKDEDGQLPIKEEPVTPPNPTETMEKLGRYGHHADPEIDAGVEIDRLEGVIAECHAAMKRALDFRTATPHGQQIKSDIRYWLRQHGVETFGERTRV